MGDASYIISFFPGTSGKLIAQVLWRMINDIDETIAFTPENSAHVSYPWENSWSHPDSTDPNIPGPRIYDKIALNDISIFATQMYPDFDVIRDRLPDSKLIIISVGEDDLKEIAFNHITKNTKVSNHYRTKFEQSGAKLDDQFWQSLIKQRQIDLLRWYKLKQDDTDLYRNFSKYYRVNVPEDFIDRVLIIKYSELYEMTGDSYVALEKLEHFTGRKATELVKHSYIQYVKNREKLWNK